MLLAAMHESTSRAGHALVGIILQKTEPQFHVFICGVNRPSGLLVVSEN